jgi:uncharacterized protein
MKGEYRLMKCPTDGETLAISNRGRIEIDYCPNCRGVWLDRGELDKIIDEFSESGNMQPDYSQRKQQEQYSTRPSNDNSHKNKKRKENFLGDLFDF